MSNSNADKQYAIRQFTAADVELYRSMRLEALQLDRGMFGNSYGYEAAFPQEQWLARITNPAGACFGLYYDTELIGITGIIADAADADPHTAYMTQSYIRKEYRGKGLSKMLYEARFAWAAAHGIRTLKIGHRRSNTTSKAANQRYGFIYTHSESRTWPDGNTEDMVYYKLEI